MQHYVLGVTVGLMNEGLKSWKKKKKLNVMDLSYLPLFKLRLTESQFVLSFHCMSFSRLLVSPEVTVIVVVSPKLLFNVTFPNLCRKG